MAGVKHRGYTWFALLLGLATHGGWKSGRVVQAATLRFGCIWRSSISATLPEVQEIAARCQEGRLLWYYPEGGLLGHFTNEFGKEEFTLCLKASEYNFVRDIYHIFGQVKSKIPAPTIGNDTCVSTQSGQCDIFFVSPNNKVDVTEIHYTIKTSS